MSSLNGSQFSILQFIWYLGWKAVCWKSLMFKFVCSRPKIEDWLVCSEAGEVHPFKTRFACRLFLDFFGVEPATAVLSETQPSILWRFLTDCQFKYGTRSFPLSFHNLLLLLISISVVSSIHLTLLSTYVILLLNGVAPMLPINSKLLFNDDFKIFMAHYGAFMLFIPLQVKISDLSEHVIDVKSAVSGQQLPRLGTLGIPSK